MQTLRISDNLVPRLRERGSFATAERREARRALLLGSCRERDRAERLLLHRAHGEEPRARPHVHLCGGRADV